MTMSQTKTKTINIDEHETQELPAGTYIIHVGDAESTHGYKSGGIITKIDTAFIRFRTVRPLKITRLHRRGGDWE